MEIDFWNQDAPSSRNSRDSWSNAQDAAQEEDCQHSRWYHNASGGSSGGAGSSNQFKRQKLEKAAARTELSDLPSSILAVILSLVRGTRARNCASLVCREWLQLERASRRALSLRGSVHELHMLPASFHAVRRLDLSNLSPWGGSPFQSLQPAVCSQLVAQWLTRAFPSVVDLTLYVRDAVDLHLLGAAWPQLHTARLVRWHQRPLLPEEAADAGAELRILLSACPSLLHLDLSSFYCWTEDVAPALESSLGEGLRTLNLLKLSPEGFRSGELAAIAGCCKNLEELRAVCEFDPRFLDCVGDECLAHCAALLGQRLRVLHLVDTSQFGGLREQDLHPGLESALTVPGLQAVFKELPELQDLALMLGQNLRDSAPVFESLSKSCKSLRSLQISHFHGVCPGPVLNGVASCGGLRRLFIRNCEDLEDLPLRLIAMGCSQLERIGLRSCGMITESGLRDLAAVLRRSLVHVEIECCQMLPTVSLLRGLLPLRSTLQTLQLDCVWDAQDEDLATASGNPNSPAEEWEKLENLSLWIPAAHVLSPVIHLGLESCPVLRNLSIRVEGDCRLFQKPRAREFGLSSFARFECLENLKLDLSEAVGYALSAPGGNRDLSIWERFYLQGIQALKRLEVLDYYPPSDKDVNYRGMTLPGAGLISLCQGLRRLFVHGTTYEHLFMMLLKIFSARDCQLRADYFPTPEMETGTEMRPDSCRRFEILLEKRGFPD